MAKTIEQRLLDKGLGHRQMQNSANTGKHEIYRISDGKVIGNFSAIESLELIRKRPHMHGWQSVTRLGEL